jgi:transposase InsO family protein
MTNSEIEFTHLNKPNKSEIINPNGDTYPVEKMGHVPISEKITLKNTLLVPSLSTKLISMGKLTEDLNCVVLMFPDYCVVQDILTGETLGRGSKRDGLYYLDSVLGTAYSTKSDSVKLREKVWLWHKRLGHPSFGYMRKLSPTLFSDLDNENFVCETCIKAKSHRTTYHLSTNKCLHPFDLVHTDVWGPSPIVSKSGYRWFVLFTDDCTRMTWLYLLKTKDEVSNIFKSFYKMVRTQFEKSIKIVRSDNGKKYINRKLQDFFIENGIIHETSCVGTPQQNRVAERKNRQILETARSLLFENQVPQLFWDNAISTAIYLLNRVPSKANDFKTPLQALATHVNIPSYLNLPPKIFGCVVYVHVQKKFRSKTEPCAEKCVFLGFGSHQKSYKCYNPKNRKFYTTMDVTFVESESYFANTQVYVQGGTMDEHELVFSNPLPTDYTSYPINSENSTGENEGNELHGQGPHGPTSGEISPPNSSENQGLNLDRSDGRDLSPTRSNLDQFENLAEPPRQENNTENSDIKFWIEADGRNEKIIQSDSQPLGPN